MGKKILVAYGSKRGSTAEIAEKIGETLRQKGLQVDVLDAGIVNDLTPYNKIILGSSVYIGLWHKNAVRFLKKNIEILEKYLSGSLYAVQPALETRLNRWMAGSIPNHSSRSLNAYILVPSPALAANWC